MRYIILLMLLCSCGARKTETHIKESDTKTESEQTVTMDVTETTKTEVETVTESDNLIISPVNPEKELVIVRPGKDTIKLKNAKIERINERKRKTVKEDKDLKDQSQKNTWIKEQKKEKSKDRTTDRKESYSWIVWVLILVFLILIIIAYLKRRS